MQNVKTKDVLVYVTMPGIVPRIKQLVSSGFSYISFLMAHVYYMARLLPQGHPYLQSENMGRFGLHNVIVEASRNLRFTRKNIDQIIIYFALLMGVVMLAAQIVLALVAIFMPSAMAFSWFNTATPQNDVAYNILDQIFGIPNIFCSSFPPITCTAYSVDPNGDGVAGPALPLPFHTALHALFRFYSTGLLLIAVLIFLYFLVVITVETVTTGTPFGKRFQNVWVPVRLVVALGLLLPIEYGLGSGQYIVLYAAKWGSSFATNGWEEFNTSVANHGMFAGGIGNSKPVGERYSTLAIPEAPSMAPLVEAMSIVHACAFAYHRLVANTDNATSGSGVYPPEYANYTDSVSFPEPFKVRPYFVKNVISTMGNTAIGSTILTGDPRDRVLLTNTARPNYLAALEFYYASDIVIRFGEYRSPATGGGIDFYTKQPGHVAPLCGEIRIPLVDLSDIGGASAAPSRGGADQMLEFYYETVMDMWFVDGAFRQVARAWVTSKDENSANIKEPYCTASEVGVGGLQLTATGVGTANEPEIYRNVPDCMDNAPDANWRQNKTDQYTALLHDEIRDAWSNHVQNAVYGNLHSDVIDRGWGGAGIWYNKIAEINGGWIDGVQALPELSVYPYVMKEVRDWRKQHSESLVDQYLPSLPAASGEEAPKKISTQDLEAVAVPLGHFVHGFWGDDDKDLSGSRSSYQNPFLDAIQLFLGINGLVSIRGANSHLHPLAQLVAVGKGLVDSAIANIGAASATAFLGGGAQARENYKKTEAGFKAASGMFEAIAFIGLSAGVVLFYVLPFLPFVYFYFAVASWVKAIFEAMVGVPLWALAHLRIDGEGLPGDAAQNGYFLILEIFIRPILTVVGLVAAIAIFGTQVRVLNLIWDLVTTNASGYGDDYAGTTAFDILSMNDVEGRRYQRGIVDQFFFTVIYTVVCYMMALASFKLIDKIPDNILRWAGAGVSSFGDMDQDNIDSLSRYATMGSMTLGGQAVGAVTGTASKAGGLVGGEMKAFFDGGKGRPDMGNLQSTGRNAISESQKFI